MSIQNSFTRLATPVILSAIILTVLLTGSLADRTIERVAVGTLIAVVFVAGLFLYSGNSGIMSFGHVSFMAIGAYSTAYLTIPVATKQSMFPDLPDFLSFLATVHAPFPLALIISALAAGVFAAITSPAMARLSGLPSGIATLAVLVILVTVLNSWTDVTRGSSNMIGIPRQTTLIWASVTALLAIAIAWGYKVSRSGLQLRASREDLEAAVASGVAVGRHRAIAWILSGVVCGLSGALYASFLTTFSSKTFFLGLTFSFIVMVVLGGYLSLSGAVIGAVGVSVLQEVLRRFQDGQLTGGSALPAGVSELILAAILLIVLVKAPMGLMGTREFTWSRMDRRGGITNG